jgi:hypothetical protein
VVPVTDPKELIVASGLKEVLNAPRNVLLFGLRYRRVPHGKDTHCFYGEILAEKG